MLQVNGGKVSFRGRRIDLMEEFCVLAHELLSKEVVEEDDLDMMVKIAKSTDDEISEKASKAMKESLEKVSPEGCVEILKLLLDL